jgi:hypothetical protein
MRFFLKYCLFIQIFMVILMTGCFQQVIISENTDVQSKKSIEQVGVLTLAYENQVNKCKFKYEQYTPSHYEMRIYPMFSKPIVLIIANNRTSLDMHGIHYDDQAAHEVLETLAPGFPWRELPTVVEHGSISSPEWKIAHWNKEGFLIAGSNSSLKWVVRD